MYQPSAPCSPPSTNSTPQRQAVPRERRPVSAKEGKGKEEGQADDAAKKAVRPFPPIDELEVFEATCPC